MLAPATTIDRLMPTIHTPAKTEFRLNFTYRQNG